MKFPHKYTQELEKNAPFKEYVDKTIQEVVSGIGIAIPLFLCITLEQGSQNVVQRPVSAESCGCNGWVKQGKTR